MDVNEWMVDVFKTSHKFLFPMFIIMLSMKLTLMRVLRQSELKKGHQFKVVALLVGRLFKKGCLASTHTVNHW